MKKVLFTITLSIAMSFLVKAQISPQEAILQMRKGINLGNTHEPPTEAGWNNPKAQEYYFDMYKEAGFNTVRIPVRWDNYTADNAPFKIQDSWLNRIEEVVDWGLERDLWIVINSHHDNWIKDNYTDPVLRARFDSIWSQIATHFADKSEKLIFEILNEPHGLSKDHNDEMHARVLSIIRKTNPTRLVIFQGNNWGSSGDLINAAIPDDPYLIGSFHSYDPWPFGLEGTGSFGTAAQINTLRNKFASVKAWSDTHNIPVFLGEFACHRSADFMSRMKHYQTYVELAHEHGFCFCVWDDGGNFPVMKRAEKKWHETVDILIHGNVDSPGYPEAEVFQDTLIKLHWGNRTTENDRILIQRGSTSTNLQTIDSIASDLKVYIDSSAEEEHTYFYRLIADFDSSESYYSHPVNVFLPAYMEAVRQPFLGEAIAIPGVLEAEDFDDGGEGLSYHDTDDRNLAGDYRSNVGVDIYDRLGDGFHVGSIEAGEWLEYTVNVAEADTYQVVAHVASVYGGGTFEIEIGAVVSEPFRTSNTFSFLDTDTVSVRMILNAGEQLMRLTVLSEPTFNIDKLEFLEYNLIPIDTSTIDTTTTDTTGYADFHSQAAGFSIYENGAGSLIVEYKGNDDIRELRIFSINGVLECIIPEPAKVMELPASDLSRGIHIFNAYSARNIYHGKFILD